jgi:diguanylate cyclase (GGDEF)-like protein
MLIDYFIHSSLKNDTEDWYRARVLVGVILVYSLILLCSNVYTIFFAPLEAFSVWMTASLIFLLLLVYISVLLVLKYRGPYVLCCHVTAGFTALGISVGVAISGGPLVSPATPVNVVPVILTFVLLGKRAGLTWAQWVLFVHAAMAVVSVVIAPFPQLLDIRFMDIFHGLHWAITYSAIIGLMLVFDSINTRLKRERDAERERFAYLASHDPLTDLANRAEFDEQLDKAVARADRRGGMITVLYLDLDGFKPINDGLGHDAGDLVLMTISRRLREHLRVSDTIARMGGDEFAIILENTGVEDSVVEASVVEASRDEGSDVENASLKNVTESYIIDGIAEKVCELISMNIPELPANMPISASIGAAVYPHHTRDKKRLLKYADMAMYEAKKNKNTWRLYEPSLEHD